MKLSQWPTPFYYKFVEKLDAFDSEPCMVVSRDNLELSGTLTRFSPEDGVIEILRSKGDIFSPKPEFINQLRLLNPVHLVKKAEFLNSPA